jgi:hypothetical protein
MINLRFEGQPRQTDATTGSDLPASSETFNSPLSVANGKGCINLDVAFGFIANMETQRNGLATGNFLIFFDFQCGAQSICQRAIIPFSVEPWLFLKHRRGGNLNFPPAR